MPAFITSVTPPFNSAQSFVVAEDCSLKTPISSDDAATLITAGYVEIDLSEAFTNTIPTAVRTTRKIQHSEAPE
jgi:hypothetical protein